MARSTWVLFGVVLMMVASAAMMGAMAVGDEEERVAADGAGTVGGDDHGTRGVETSGAGVEAAEVGDQGVGRGACLEEGEASGVEGGDDSTLQDLPELSSGFRPTRLCQGMIFEMFEAESGRRRQSSERTSAPVVEEE